MCHGFLSTGEVLWLRRLFSAHQGWAMYNWGSVGKNGGVGKNGDLASMLERIDFGPAEMQARCSEMHRSPATPPHGRLQPYPTGATPSLHDTPHQAEGVAAAKSFIQPVGELRQACSLVITPCRHHPTCGRAARMLRSYHPSPPPPSDLWARCGRRCSTCWWRGCASSSEGCGRGSRPGEGQG